MVTMLTWSATGGQRSAHVPGNRSLSCPWTRSTRQASSSSACRLYARQGFDQRGPGSGYPLSMNEKGRNLEDDPPPDQPAWRLPSARSLASILASSADVAYAYPARARCSAIGKLTARLKAIVGSSGACCDEPVPDVKLGVDQKALFYNQNPTMSTATGTLTWADFPRSTSQI
jgi:hypothetical protein